MTALTDVHRMARFLSGGDEQDEQLLLRHYGALGPNFLAESQAHIAGDFGITRQAVHARIKRLLGQIQGKHLSALTVDEPTRHAIASGSIPSPRTLGRLKPENAIRFYRDLTGTHQNDLLEPPMAQIAPEQFDALTQAAYGVRRQARTHAARLILVSGMALDEVTVKTRISPRQIMRDVRDVMELHEQAIRAYSAPLH